MSVRSATSELWQGHPVTKSGEAANARSALSASFSPGELSRLCKRSVIGCFP